MAGCYGQSALDDIIIPEYCDRRSNGLDPHRLGFNLRDNLLSTTDRPFDLLTLALDAIHAPATSPKVPGDGKSDYSESLTVHGASSVIAPPLQVFKSRRKSGHSSKEACMVKRSSSTKQTKRHFLPKIMLLRSASSHGTEERSRLISRRHTLPTRVGAPSISRSKINNNKNAQKGQKNDERVAELSGRRLKRTGFPCTSGEDENPNSFENKLNMPCYSRMHSGPSFCPRLQRKAACSTFEGAPNNIAIAARAKRDSDPFSPGLSSSECAFEHSAGVMEEMPFSKRLSRRVGSSITRGQPMRNDLQRRKQTNTVSNSRPRKGVEASCSTVHQGRVEGDVNNPEQVYPSDSEDGPRLGSARRFACRKGQQTYTDAAPKSKRRRCKKGQTSKVGNRERPTRRNGVFKKQTGTQFDELVSRGTLDRHLWAQERKRQAKTRK